jgi:hypothetical protein
MKHQTFLRLVIFSFTILLTIFGCSGGGGDDSWLFPLWITTDVIVADTDNDNRNDILTLARLSTSMSHNEGHLRIYRQADHGSFLTPNTYIVGEYPWQVVSYDIDGDTLPDLVVTDVDLDNVQLLLQEPDGDGQFFAPMQIADGVNAYETAVGDFNNDGTSDIAIVDNYIGSNRIVILYQDPFHKGIFQPASELKVPGSSSNIASGDLDGDDLDDLVTWVYLETSSWTPNGVLAISLQQPDGTFGPISTLAPQTGLNVGLLSIADYDEDGANDLFVFFTPFSVDFTAKLTVILQDPATGKFSAPIDTTLAGVKGLDDAVVADLNGDGRPDFATVGFFPEGSPSKVKSRLNIFMQSGGGKFSLYEVYEMPVSVSRVAAGDVNDDGLNDLIVLGGENQCMLLFQSTSNMGTFQQPKLL